jgi:hypothetical protein
MTSDAVMQLGSWATLISSRRCLKVIDTFRAAGTGGEEQRKLFS